MESGQNVANTETSVLFGEWLVNKGCFRKRSCKRALEEQQRRGGKLGEVLVRLKILNENDITAALSEYLNIERIELDNISKLDMNVARLIPESIAKRFCAIAIGESENSVVIAMAIRSTLSPLIQSNIKSNGRSKSSYAHRRKYARPAMRSITVRMWKSSGCVTLCSLRSAKKRTEDFFDEDMTSADISSEALASKPPVIRFVDLLLSQAVKSRASDIHVEPQENSMSIQHENRRHAARYGSAVAKDAGGGGNKN